MWSERGSVGEGSGASGGCVRAWGSVETGDIPKAMSQTSVQSQGMGGHETENLKAASSSTDHPSSTVGKFINIDIIHHLQLIYLSSVQGPSHAPPGIC